MKKLIILACIIAVTAILALGASSGALAGGIGQAVCGPLTAHGNPSDPAYPAYQALCENWPGPTLP